MAFSKHCTDRTYFVEISKKEIQPVADLDDQVTAPTSGSAPVMSEVPRLAINGGGHPGAVGVVRQGMRRTLTGV